MERQLNLNKNACVVCDNISEKHICHECSSSVKVPQVKYKGGRRFNSEHLVRRKKQDQINKLKLENKNLLLENRKIYKELFKVKKMIDCILNRQSLEINTKD